MKTNKFLLTTAILGSLTATAFAADTTIGTGDGIAYGTETQTSTYSSVAIGNTVKSSGQDSIGIGYDVTVDGFNSIAIGSSRNKPGFESSPQKTIVTGDSNIGIGHKAEVSDGYESVAIGSSARVYNDNSTTRKYPAYSTVIGSSARSTGYDGTAYGRYAEANENEATALGPWTEANGTYSTAITYAAKANSEDSIAVGHSAEVNGSGSTAIGKYTRVNGEDSLAIGSASQANSNNSIAIGTGAIADGENNIALGYGSSSTDVVKTSHALVNGHYYKFAGSDPIGTLSIGGEIEEPVLDANGDPIYNEDYSDYLKTKKQLTRTITNVAAGRISDTSTDAINGSQLHSVIEETNKLGDKVNKNKEVLDNHEGRITTLENKVADIGSDVIKEANSYTDSQVAHVGAQSAALAGLHPLDFNKDDKASYAASVGHYRNANAVAVGAFYRPNERTMVSGAISFGKHVQMNIGVAFKTGKGSEYINEAKSKDSRIEKLEAMVQKLTAEVAELKANK